VRTAKQTILYVDDDADLRFSVSGLLDRAGYEVATAGSANEAFERLSARHFDALSTDYWAPKPLGEGALLRHVGRLLKPHATDRARIGRRALCATALGLAIVFASLGTNTSASGRDSSHNSNGP
jgi:CheY-like chemotaxis protein